MNRKSKWLMSLVAVSIIFIMTLSIWAILESGRAYEEPKQAVLAENGDLILLPAYRTSEEALFFFIEDNTNLGAVMVHQNLFGWSTDSFVWSSIDSITTEEKIGGHQIYGDEVIFGLMKGGAERIMTVDSLPANMIDLESILTEVQDPSKLNGLSLWYYETDEVTNAKRLSLINSSTNIEIDTSLLSNSAYSPLLGMDELSKC